ncbi:hypothetical protein [Sulfobacillus harzensis]|uniref:Uncharacterized protein n=1 Tax=Sulfobacillus harzensis TaxID=2729629 RepID=A0A7Y0Q3X4_9FIRM|nr:hypothetical protein [Sulfobacillus harzensis]NMP23825.1 hypothetical protein [Sulfobacillus harzensis]
MTDEEIQRARARYARFLDESEYTGADMLRLLEAVEAAQTMKEAVARERETYYDLMIRAQTMRGQALQELRAERETNAAVIGLLATLFPASYEQNTAHFDPAADWLLIIDLPTGQVAFPYGDMEIPTAALPFYAGRVYDGHTLADRTTRLRECMERMGNAPRGARKE